MKERLVKKWFCEHCKKSGGRRDIIERHESACTSNPNRLCRCCLMAAQKQASIRELLTALAKDIDGEQDGFGTVLTELRRVAKDCPACILTAIRNSPQPVWADFTFADEMAAWLEIHGTQRGDE
ncbi:hypothetical protein UFOVP1229_76 [uncultured Caudovirales phage]|uniref:Uncharacterized protein n=1 Tax=uncultured Caudovirales phage TaxID=2100421 RepID=A0A6J5R2Z2_9CAUD|nr:hypothetical protein UFOVP1229_76 [uncultured Caudovirales phage]